MAKKEDIQRMTRRYIRRLKRNIRIDKAILTGSWANGTYLEDSDVDLIIVSDGFSNMALPDRLRYLQKEWKNRIPLEAFGYTTDEFQKLRRKSIYLGDAIRSGIELTEKDPRHIQKNS